MRRCLKLLAKPLRKGPSASFLSLTSSRGRPVWTNERLAPTGGTRAVNAEGTEVRSRHWPERANLGPPGDLPNACRPRLDLLIEVTNGVEQCLRGQYGELVK